MKDEILEWLISGCNIDQGVKLLESYSKNRLLVRLVKTNPAKSLNLVIKELSSIAGIVASNANKIASDANNLTLNVNFKPKKYPNFRQEFPFLNEPGCPMELRALVTDKFSSYFRYRELHARLTDCLNTQECAELCGEIIENYLENRAIYAELDYYKKHKTILGKHPIFKHFNRMKDLRKLGIKELVKKQIQLEHNIWRIESELTKKDKPHLDGERRRRLDEKKAELSEVERLLG